MRAARETPTIRTTRLILRAPTADDVEATADLANDWDIARRMSRLPHPYGLEDAHFYLREIVPHELAWAVTSGADGRLMGFAGVVPDASGGSADLGYWLGRPYWGQGFATEASEAIIGHMFGSLALPSLTSGCFEDNVASRRVLEKTGFVEVGRGVRACLALGRDLPIVEMELSR